MANSEAEAEPADSPRRRSKLSRIAATFGALLVHTAALPLLPVNWWWVRIWDFPRVQLLVLYVVAVGLTWLWRYSRLIQAIAALLIAAALWQASWIYPYLPLAPKTVQAARQASPQTRLRVLTANVLQPNRTAAPLLEIVRRADPDVLIAVETDAWWIERLSALDETHPYSVKQPQSNKYGMALFSKLPIVRSDVRFLTDPEIPSIHAAVRLRTGDEAQIIALHPNPPSVGEGTGQRDAELVVAGRLARASGLPALIGGDLNDVGWSRTTLLFQRVSRMLDPRHGRGIHATYPAQYPPLQYPLDHLFHSEHFRLVSIDVLGRFGSDHLPLLVELSYEPQAALRQGAPPLTEEAQERAAEATREDVDPNH